MQKTSLLRVQTAGSSSVHRWISLGGQFGSQNSIAGALCPYVTDLVICDPRHNSLIRRSGNKISLEWLGNLLRYYIFGTTPKCHTEMAKSGKPNAD